MRNVCENENFVGLKMFEWPYIETGSLKSVRQNSHMPSAKVPSLATTWVVIQSNHIQHCLCEANDE